VPVGEKMFAALKVDKIAVEREGLIFAVKLEAGEKSVDER